jgi:signal transduction histidine kinase
MNYFAFSALVNGLTSISLGTYALKKGFESPLNRSYAFFAFSVFFWSLGYFFWQLSSSAASALFWTRVLMAGAVLIPVAYFNFSLWLTNKYSEKSRESVLSYAVGVIFLVLDFTPLMVKGVSRKMIFSFWPEPGMIYPLFLLMFFFYVLYSLLIMFSVYRKSSGYLRAQIIYVFLGTAIGFAGGSTNFLLWYDIPVLPVANILVLAYPLLLAYAILKHHLMDISVVISRAVAEILAILFHGTIYLILVWFYRTFASTSIDLPFLIWTVLYGILVGQTHQGIRIFLQTTSDKLFLRGRYDYYRALADASSKVGEKLALPDILKVLYKTFSDVVEISNPRIFLPEYFTESEKTSSCYLVYDKNGLPQKEGARIQMVSPLVEKLLAKREPLYEVGELKADLVVPCLLEDRLIAIFALGPKLSEDPYTDEDLRLLKVLANQVAVALDHTHSYEKIKSELEMVGRQLERSQRLASMGTLIAGVTHEIRNPLTVIHSETERLPNEARDLEYLKQHRALILKHIDRITGIVQRMLNLAREKPLQHVDVDLNDVIDSVLLLIPISRISLKKELGKIPNIKGDTGGLSEVFVNLIQNALEAMPDGGILTLRTYQEDHHVVAEVADTGRGIPEELREKIFDPFFSTRHEGVGLGLSIAYRIIREHGADMKVFSEAGKGTAFKITFPF